MVKYKITYSKEESKNTCCTKAAPVAALHVLLFIYICFFTLFEFMQHKLHNWIATAHKVQRNPMLLNDEEAVTHQQVYIQMPLF